MKYEIIGHCNSALCIILDAVKFIEKNNDISITIVSACNDDFLSKASNILFNPWLTIEEITTETWKPELESFRIIAAMDNETRREIFNNVEELFNASPVDFNNLLHPSSYCSCTAVLGHGILVSPNSTIAPFSRIGDFTYINRNVSIGHHTTIKEFCTISPRCNIASKCLIENNVEIGIGATILDGIRIREDSTIGAGAVVTKNTESNSIYYGVPAKLIRKKQGKN